MHPSVPARASRSHQSTPIIAVAPMMEWTDRHCRYFLRCISQHVWLYTEMIHAHAVIHGDRQRLLAYHPAEHPLALQLGGSDPALLAEAAYIVATLGYDEINLNVGCPSPRVSAGRFGACLMAEPSLVADCVAAMCARVNIPVTVKTRIGIDNQDSFEALSHFIDAVAQAGCQTFIIHARKAWLHGLSPKENRTVPPLRYDVVYQLAQSFPSLRFMLNGGLETETAIAEALTQLPGVMLGRAAYHDPYILAHVDKDYFRATAPIPTREDIIHAMLPYIETHLRADGRLADITRHMLGLFHGQPYGRIWRRVLSENAHMPGADSQCLLQALSQMH